MRKPTSGTPLDALAAEVDRLPAVLRTDLRSGDWLLVTTRNSVYSLCLLDDNRNGLIISSLVGNNFSRGYAIEIKDGKRRTVERRVFPGYILVQMAMSDAAWHVVKNTPKVTGFVGSGKNPTPLTQEEVDQILQQVVSAKEKPKPKYIFDKGEPVKIIDGPVNNVSGVVEEVNLDRNTLKVMVTIFGRHTPVELDFSQVQKL